MPLSQPETKSESKALTALGLMSGTSMDGIDAALLTTDGALRVAFGATLSVPYDPPFRERLRAVLGQITGRTAELDALTAELTARHQDVVAALLSKAGLEAGDVDLIGFHGQTIAHAPERGLTRQLGDGAAMAKALGIAVVDDFRAADMAAGGQGAPFAPLYHAALIRGGHDKAPAAVLNLGGVGNVTWVGAGAGVEESLLAFDTGPGNALIDDWMLKTTGRAMDEGGQLARTGVVDETVLATLLGHPYFDQPLPKSLDRDAFSLAPVEGLSPEDGAATLSAFTVETVARAEALLPGTPRSWIVTGGGRRNGTLMSALADRLVGKVVSAEDVGWDGDALEAQAFAYLAVRSRYGLALSVPTTTGVPRPTPGGCMHLPSGKK